VKRWLVKTGFFFVLCLLFVLPVHAAVDGAVVTPANSSVANGTLVINITFTGPTNITIESAPSNGVYTIINTSTNQTSPFVFNWNTTGIADGLNYTLQINITNTTNGTQKDVLFVVSFTIDNTNPNLTLNSPADSTTTNNGTITLNWSTADSVDTNLSCALFINSTLNQTVFGTGDLTAQLAFVDGLYTWNVSCTDDTGNTNTSAARTLTVDTAPPTVAATALSSAIVSAVINATSNETSTFTAFYGTSSGNLPSTQAGGTNTVVNITLSGLTANTQYYFIVQGCDAASNCDNSTETTVTTQAEAASSSSSGGSGSGKAPPAAPTPLSTDPTTVALSKFSKHSFSVGGATHSVQMKEIHNNKITIVFNSDPVEITLAEGEEQNIDITGDGVEDIYVKVTSLSQYSATLDISTPKTVTEMRADDKSTEEEVVAESQQALEEPEEEIAPSEAPELLPTIREEEKKRNPVTTAILSILVIAIIGTIVWWTKKKQLK